MNSQLEVLYQNCCKQDRVFLGEFTKKGTYPHKKCLFFEKTCRSDFFCRQLIKKPVVGSWYVNLLQLKRWLQPGEAVYARRNATGGLTVTTDPFPFIGHQYPKEKSGTILVSKRNKLCGNGCGREVSQNTNLCKKCRPLFGLPPEEETKKTVSG